MKLASYLENTGTSDAEFARLIGVERQAVHRYKSGSRFPEKKILSEIYRVTGGQVDANDFADLEPMPDAEDEPEQQVAS